MSDLVSDIQALSEEFDNLCRARHEMGASEYGPTKFLQNNMFDMMVEELADMANYARYQSIKIRLIQKQLPNQFNNMTSEQFKAVIESLWEKLDPSENPVEAGNLGPESFIPQGQGTFDIAQEQKP